jgi:general secretion pathway protein E
MDTMAESTDVVKAEVSAHANTNEVRGSLQPSFSYAKRQGIILQDKPGEAGEAGMGRMAYCRNDVSSLTIAELQRKIKSTIDFQFVSGEKFESLLMTTYEQSEGQQISNFEIDDSVDLSSIAEQLAEPEDLLESADDAPIIRLINAILAAAIKEQASDIHIEPFEQYLVVRVRVDGILREVVRPPRELATLLVSRIKVMAELDIAEKRLPQDGRISLKLAGRAIDVRVSTLPTGAGERVVLRLLDNQAGRLKPEHLGMDEPTRLYMEAAIEKPHGVILVTGPTGSGKTTTLYAILSQLNNNRRNLITIEDPIEYYLQGVGQTQVDSKVDMTFAKGLRAILRQDPDVVMIGEIRDSETASIAIQASLTGHMVLSTLHTNTAAGSITRLRDMGVEPFLLSSSLEAVISQRLVRVLCQHCCEAYEADELEKQLLGFYVGEIIMVYRATGCKHCNHQGYKGRTGIYELLLVDSEIKRIIHESGSEMEIESVARRKTRSLIADGARLVLEGVTSTDEVFRVTRSSN